LPDLEQLLEKFRENESVRLFEERAQLAKLDFSLTLENASSIAQICHRLDGIPLAIELAAAHVNMFTAEQLAARLNESFNLLTGGSRTALPRQQTIRASIEWSWSLLTDSERILLQRLSVFAGGWTLEAAESVCSGNGIESDQVSEVMHQLVAKSLVVVNQGPKHQRRYHLLETIRQYVNEKLEEAEEDNRTRDSHLDYFLTLTETAAPNLLKPEQLEWLVRLEAERENMRVALNWSLNKERPEYVLRFCAALGTFWYMHCYWVEGANWLKKAFAKSSYELTDAERVVRARALYHDAELADAMDDMKRMQASAEASLALCEASTDSHDRAIARFYVGLAFQRLEDNESARPSFEKSLTEFRELKDLYWEATTQRSLSSILVKKGEKSRSEAIAQNIDLARRAGERLLLAEVLFNQATWAWNEYQTDKAEACLKESEALNGQIGHSASMGSFYQAVIAHFNRDYQQARIMYTKFKVQCELIGEKGQKSLAIVNIGIVAKEEGNYQQARSYIEEALKIAQEIGSKNIIGYRLALLAEIEHLQGNLQGAKKSFQESMSIGRELVDEPYTKCGILLIFSKTYESLQPQNSMRLLGAANTFLRVKNFDEPLDPFFIRDSDRAVAQAHQSLDKLTFDRVWAEGQKLTIDEAYDLALKVAEEM